MTSVVMATSIEDWGIQLVDSTRYHPSSACLLHDWAAFEVPCLLPSLWCSVDRAALDHGTAFCSLIVTHKLPFTAGVFHCILGGVFVAIYRFGGFQSSSSAQTGRERRRSLNGWSEENIKWL